MANLQYQNQKEELIFSKSQLNKLAEKIRRGCSIEEKTYAISAIQNFRKVHNYPLMLIKNHVARIAGKVDKKIIIARRLKRLSTIINKIERRTLDGVTQNSIALTRMQDIGGCRIIVNNINQLNQVMDKLLKSKTVHKIKYTRDYLSHPKASGYGGMHLIYEMFSSEDVSHSYKGLKIEVQLRTELQHAWATSLEIIDTLEGIALKTATDGYEDWRRFFYISGLLVAHEDGFCSINDSDQLINYRTELDALEEQLNVREKLRKYTLIIRGANIRGDKKRPRSSGDFWVLINIKFNDNKFFLKRDFFKKSEYQKANEKLIQNEGESDILVTALVSSSDAKNLKKAYPNYFGSTSKFNEFIDNQLSKL